PSSWREFSSAIGLHPHILLVENRNIQLLWLLGFVRMVSTGIDAQVLHLAASKRPARNHALDCLLDHTLGETALEDVARSALLDAAWMTGVPVILLVFVLAAGKADLVRIDDDDVVTIVNMGREGWLVLAAQTVGNESGETADNEILGVDQDPLLRYFRRLLRKGFHGFASISIPAGEPAGRFLLLEPMAIEPSIRDLDHDWGFIRAQPPTVNSFQASHIATALLKSMT